MADLIAMTFNDRETAQRVRYDFARMSREHLVELEDMVVAYKDGDGKLRLDQTVDLTTGGAVSGGFWGLLIGFLFSIPTGGPLLPAITTVFGAGFGALSGSLADYGIDDNMIRELAAGLDDGKATLFVLARKLAPDKVVRHLEGYEGELLTTSLPHEVDAKIQEVLSSAETRAA